MATIKNKFAAILAFFGWAQVEASSDGIFLKEDDLEKLDAELSSLQQQVKDKDTEIAAEQAKVTAAEKKVTDLTAQVSTLTTEKKDLQAKLDLKPEAPTEQPVTEEDNIDTPETKKTGGSVTAEARERYAKAQAKKQKQTT